jgi:hypothetical protein
LNVSYISSLSSEFFLEKKSAASFHS